MEKEIIENRVAAFVRLGVALLFGVLVALIATGIIDASALEAAVASVLAIATLVLAWWKDNNVTIKAILRHMTGVEIVDEIDDDAEIVEGAPEHAKEL